MISHSCKGNSFLVAEDTLIANGDGTSQHNHGEEFGMPFFITGFVILFVGLITIFVLSRLY